MAFNKPANLHSVCLQGGKGQSLAALALLRYPELALASRDAQDAGFISRLDFQTSGLIIAAKDRGVWEKLRALSAAEQLHKRYIAVLRGNIHKPVTVNAWLGSRYRRSKKISCFENASDKDIRAQRAQTLFKPLSYNPIFDLSLVLAEFSIGRRHQVRAHAAHIGHALYGDNLYDGRPTKRLWDGPEFLLHSFAIDFILEEQQQIEAPLPEYFESFVDQNFKDWKMNAALSD